MNATKGGIDAGPSAESERVDRTLIAGMSGLGSTAAVYLAVADIGKTVFAHSGSLTLSNMNRQILIRHDWIGKSRAVQGR